MVHVLLYEARVYKRVDVSCMKGYRPWKHGSVVKLNVILEHRFPRFPSIGTLRFKAEFKRHRNYETVNFVSWSGFAHDSKRHHLSSDVSYPRVRR